MRKIFKIQNSIKFKPKFHENIIFKYTKLTSSKYKEEKIFPNKIILQESQENIILKNYMKENESLKAENYFVQLPIEKKKNLYIDFIKYLIKKKNIVLSEKLFQEMIELKIELNLFIFNSFINYYLENKNIKYQKKLIKENHNII
jgi:pentatricopeptide repeat protein